MVTMFLAGSTDRWHWSEDAVPALAFCVHALVHDGLQVRPFDRHPDGDGGLQALGLVAELWREWVATVLRQQAIMAEYGRHIHTELDRSERRAMALGAFEVLRRPGAFCPGSADLRARLDELWTTYAPTGEAWQRRMTTGPRGIRNRLAPHEQRRLWKALLPLHDRLPTISVFLVDYPTPAVMALPPTTCLIAPAGTSGDYLGQVLAAAVQLGAGR